MSWVKQAPEADRATRWHLYTFGSCSVPCRAAEHSKRHAEPQIHGRVVAVAERERDPGADERPEVPEEDDLRGELRARGQQHAPGRVHDPLPAGVPGVARIGEERAHEPPEVEPGAEPPV